MNKDIFDFTAQDSRGQVLSLDQYRGKVLIIVNTASKCGLTPQFDALEQLYKKYKADGLEIIGFPCGQFAGQELKDGEAAHEFCQLNYGVSFKIMQKVDVNGDDTHPIFAHLKSKTKHWLFGSRIKWNFTKFLISRDGERVTRFAPFTKPEKMEEAIRKALGLV